MSESFESVTAVKKANVYFDGQVVSRTILFPDGSKKTLGYMQPGSYSFGTEAAELMEVLGGMVDIQLAGSIEWTVYQEGDAFNVPARSRFELKVSPEGFDYCCSYL